MAIHRSRVERTEGKGVDGRLILKVISRENIKESSDSSDPG
jgi:hypothetical protein